MIFAGPRDSVCADALSNSERIIARVITDKAIVEIFSVELSFLIFYFSILF